MTSFLPRGPFFNDGMVGIDDFQLNSGIAIQAMGRTGNSGVVGAHRHFDLV